MHACLLLLSGKVGPISHPERYDLKGAGEAMGLTGYDPKEHTIEPGDSEQKIEWKKEQAAHGRKEFYEMIEVLSQFEGVNSAGVPLRNSTSAVEAQVKKGDARVTHPMNNLGLTENVLAASVRI